MRRIIEGKTNINFKPYPVGEDQDVYFKLPLNSKKLSLHFNKQGHIVGLSVIYDAKRISVEMTIEHEWFSLKK